jgi:hypothetical protein
MLIIIANIKNIQEAISCIVPSKWKDPPQEAIKVLSLM